MPMLPFAVLLMLVGNAVGAETASESTYPRLTLWPLAYHSSSAESSTTDILWPFWHQQRRGSEESWQLRPELFTYTIDPARDYRRADTLFRTIRFERTDEDHWNHLFPVYWQGNEGERDWFHLWPLYGQWSENNGKKGRTTLWPFFTYRSNSNSEDWSGNYFWPLGNNWREGEASGGRLLPLYWWRTEPERRAGFVVPYYWDRRPEEQSNGIFPLWYRQIAPDARFNQIGLYLGYRSEAHEFDALIPFGFRQSKGEEEFQLLLPFWLRSIRGNSETTALMPFWLEHQSPRRSFQALFPFYWNGSEGNSQLRLLIPLHGKFRDEVTETSLWFPFYFHHRDDELDSDLHYYFPVYGRYQRGETIDERYYLFPLYAHSVDTGIGYESGNVLWPMFHYDRSGEKDYQAWALPFFWSKRSDEQRLSMALALYWSSERPSAGFTLMAPVYWDSYSQTGSQRHILPFYSDVRRSDGWRKRFYLGPLAIRTDNPNIGLSQTDILWPLISRRKKETQEHTRVLPFYWNDQGPTRQLALGSAAGLPPYYVHYKKIDEEIHHLWPFYGVNRDSDYRETSVFWPLFRRGVSDDGKRSAWQVLLAFGNRDGEEASHAFIPLWWHRQQGASVENLSLLHLYSGQGKANRDFAFVHIGHPEASLLRVNHQGAERHQHLFPFYGYTRNTDEDRTDFRFLWPIYNYERQGDTSSSWRVLWRFLHSEKSAQGELFEFNPFFYRERAADGELYTAYLGGVFSTLERSGSTEKSLFWFLKW